MTPVEVVVLALVAGSVAFSMLAVVGFARLPDVFARTHAASKSETLGALLGLGAAAVAFGPTQAALKIVLLAAFVLVTGPTAAHAIVRAATRSGETPVTDGGSDHLGDTASASTNDTERGR
ncbi:monovalent cation/H(+) antiporter subunit G [Halobaculum marinum]|uniref:Monovalent cation/H(+) antiporter subunit G n=1 Tax=Halobaculum marinum TaxID=3031996 RepID=A0ABD5WVC8_9EURY|nr:monovalent cation/H(+) antiporter subunit G [Halobaculum sp. DT55]